MKNSQLALRVFIGLVLLTGLISIIIFAPIILLVVGIFLFMVYMFFCIIDGVRGYIITKKWNIFYHISKFLDSFPQIIKDKK